VCALIRATTDILKYILLL